MILATEPESFSLFETHLQLAQRINFLLGGVSLILPKGTSIKMRTSTEIRYELYKREVSASSDVKRMSRLSSNLHFKDISGDIEKFEKD